MPIALKRYQIFDRDGNLVFEGTADECASRFDLTAPAIRSAANLNYRISNKRYSVVDCDSGKWRKDCTDEAIRSWDEFVTPIRKKYNIPVYKAKPEVSK